MIVMLSFFKLFMCAYLINSIDKYDTIGDWLLSDINTIRDS